MKKLIFVLAYLLLAVPCPAGTITVDNDGPADFNNIQAAINDANNGDAVIVAPGTYTGPGNRDIDFKSKAITVRSIDPNDPNIVAATIIDCQGTKSSSHRGFYFHSGENTASALNGLTITNGYATDGYGGGIRCNSSSPAITNCIFVGNSASFDRYGSWGFGYGGGMYNYSSSPTIINCTFAGNSASTSGFGGGMCNISSSPAVTHCTFTGNSAGVGGGMFNRDNSNPAVTNCTFTGNSVSFGGGGMYNSSGSPTITNCTFSGNSASEGGGMENFSSSPTVTNCAFSRNSAGRGGGIYNNESSPAITDCNISNNTAGGYGGGIYGCGGPVTNCVITGNSAGDGGGLAYCDGPITNCVITGNSAVSNGGGGLAYCDGPITNCTITGNSASDGGGLYACGGLITNCVIRGNTGGRCGGIYCYESSPTINNCTISGNIGGGIWCVHGSNPAISKCTITGNSTGGGILCRFGGNATITDCNISGNSAGGDGGGIYCEGGNSKVTNCIIIGNSAGRHGGGLFLFHDDCPITNCTITGNSAYDDGGGIFGCEGPITNCTIANNSGHRGGGLHVCSGPITNCTITGNSAIEGGGLDDCGGPIKNCTIAKNTAKYGGGLYNCRNITNCIITANSSVDDGGGMSGCRQITNCTITGNSASEGGGLAYGRGLLTNCIIWDNWPEQIYGWRFLNFTYCNVQGGWPGTGNIDADPCFIEPGYWVDANDPNIIVEPNDPNAVWLDGDYRLLFDSPCIDTGDPNYVSGPNETDLDGNPRVFDGDRDGSVVVDMGAYEYQNTPPVAVAGPNQVAYAFIDGFVDVTFDGSASFDDDNDVLDYYWSWMLGPNTYETNGINPTIKLPVGNHTIELVVDDGIDSSEPDYCTITVIRAVRGRLMLSPRVIETKSCGRWILATLFIPPVPGEKANTSQPLRLYPSGIEAKYQRFYRYGMFRCAPTFAIAFFDKQQVIDDLGTGQFEVSVVGEFLSGRFFFGSDTIKIITHKPPHHWHW